MTLSVVKYLSPAFSNRFKRVDKPTNWASYLSCLLFAVLPLFCQQPQSDPQAVALAAQSIAALTNGTVIVDVTLSGSVPWTGGTSSENGTASAYGKSNVESRLALTLPDGSRSEAREEKQRHLKPIEIAKVNAYVMPENWTRSLTP